MTPTIDHGAVENDWRARGCRGSGRPHLLGIDDGPFTIRSGGDATIVGVVTEGHDLIESVAVTRFAIDGADVNAFLAAWIAGLRIRPALHGIVLGGITIAGLAVVDIVELARALALPVLAVGRRDPRAHRLTEALAAAALGERVAIVRRTPPALPVPGGGFVACAGTSSAHAAALVAAGRHKSNLPEALRVAHLIAAAVVRGESRGRP